MLLCDLPGGPRKSPWRSVGTNRNPWDSYRIHGIPCALPTVPARSHGKTTVLHGMPWDLGEVPSYTPAGSHWIPCGPPAGSYVSPRHVLRDVQPIMRLNFFRVYVSNIIATNPRPHRASVYRPSEKAETHMNPWEQQAIRMGTRGNPHGHAREKRELTEITYNSDGLPRVPAGIIPLSSAASLGLPGLSPETHGHPRSSAGVTKVFRGTHGLPWYPTGTQSSPQAPTASRCISW